MRRASFGGPWAARLSLVASVPVLLAPGIPIGPGKDAAVFVLFGERLRDGFVPYRDMWDHKPPGVYLLNAAGQTILPWLDPALVSWVLSVVFTAGSILIVQAMICRLASRRSAWLWSLVCLVGIASYPMVLGGGLTEPFALWPLLGATWLVVTRPGRPVSGSLPAAELLRDAGCGFLLACACLLSLQAAPAAIVVGAAAAIGDWRLGPELVKGAARRIAALVAVGVGGFAVAAPTALCLVAVGAWSDALDQLLTYNQAYRNAVGSDALLPVVVLMVGWLVVAATISVALMLRAPRNSGRVEWISLAWLLAMTLYLAYQGRLYLHYLVLLAPPLVALAVAGTRWLARSLALPDAGPRLMAMPIAAVFVAGISVSALVTGDLLVMTLTTEAGAKSDADRAAAWIHEHASRDGSLFVWGDDPALYLLSGLSPSDRYLYEFPLITPGYGSPARTAAVVEEWASHPPAVIAETPSAVPLFRAPQSDSDDRNLDSMGPLRDFVRRHYVIGASFGAIDLYVLST
jgi:hypothetical protein